MARFEIQTGLAFDLDSTDVSFDNKLDAVQHALIFAKDCIIDQYPLGRIAVVDTEDHHKIIFELTGLNNLFKI